MKNHIKTIIKSTAYLLTIIALAWFVAPARAGAAGSVSVWWPTDNAAVSGTQPFKALVDGTSLSDYSMYWQVDNGQLNQMSDSQNGGPHKEAAVDVSSWHWNANGAYSINFVAKDAKGNIIGQKQSVIHVNAANTNIPITIVPAAQQNATSAPTVSKAIDPDPVHAALLAKQNQLNAGLISTQTNMPTSTASKTIDPDPVHAQQKAQLNGASATGTAKTIDPDPVHAAILAAQNQSKASTNPVPAAIVPAVVPTIVPTPVIASAQSDPLSGLSFYVDPNSESANQAKAWASSDPAGAQEMEKIAIEPAAEWLGDWDSNISADAKKTVDAAQNSGTVPVFIAYDIPERDCNGYSSGGAASPDAYKAWINGLASGIGGRRAVVILEPDALSLMDCLSQNDKATRLSLLSFAVGALKANGNTTVYIDAGHSNWISVPDMASRLASAGIAQADGFSLNVSNFYSTADQIAYGTAISALTGNKHFVVDTSRNGLGANGDEWCNPQGRALGAKPTAATGNPIIDALLWLKAPGESDGACNGGPNAGVWWPQYALGLAQRAAY